jgi:uncharacterized membrane-anchored protein
MSNRKTLSVFAGAVLVQVLILAAVPGQKMYTLLTGRTVVLRTAPVDPYDILSGYYVTLSYEISRFANVPGSAAFDGQEDGTPLYVVLCQGEDGFWQAESVHPARPDVAADRIVIKGRKESWRTIEYGIETYYIPEAARGTIEDDLRRRARDARIEVKVDRFGRAALVRLLIGDRVYDY